MAEETTAGTEETPTDAAPAPEGKRGMLPVIGGVVAGLALGGVVGVLALGPKLAGHGAHAAKPGADSAVAEAPRKASDGPPPIYQMDNLVLNPAGSGGAHFLLMSVALEARDAAAIETIKGRDAELRDVILRLFGSKTSEQVAEASSREALRAEVLTAVNGMFGRGVVRKVYFPQFVIQ